MDKRSFLRNISLAGFGMSPLIRNIDKWVDNIDHLSPEEAAQEEDFWARIRSGYRLKPEYINLENGYYCIMPQEILEHYVHHARYVNYQGSYYMRNFRRENKGRMAAKLAAVAGCSAEELIITRNATEALDLVIAGVHWESGDQAVMAEQDYGAMRQQFWLQERRHGINVKTISVPNHPKSDEEIVDLYASVITERTRLLMVCHIINITGQILPIRKICDMAHSKGVEVLVDGAHAFAHFNFSIDELGCDYYGTSLHKWLSAPLGAGFLYVRKDRIPSLWPLLAENEDTSTIRHLNHIGTHPVHTDLAIGNALEYYTRIGPQRKEARLRYLQRYWSDQARKIPGVVVNTPVEMHRSCGIANVGIEGMEPKEMAEKLMSDHQIFTVAINHPPVVGCRISPNIYTTTSELDALVRALKVLSKT